MIGFCRAIYATLEGFAGRTEPPERVLAAIEKNLFLFYAERPELKGITISVAQEPGLPYTISFSGLAADSPLRVEFYSAWLQVMMERSAALAGMAAGYQLKAEKLLKLGNIVPGAYENGAAKLEVFKTGSETTVVASVGGITYTWRFDDVGKRKP